MKDRLASWKIRLEPAAQMYAEMVRELQRWLEDKNESELALLAEDAKRATNSNCGWHLYAVSKLIYEEASFILKVRGMKAAEAAS